MAVRKTVLVVDDELSMRIFIATLLETSGYAPVVCKDGRDGVRKARELHPDLIILDVMMPGEGGVQMYRTLKTEPALREIPVIMLSAVEADSFSHFLRMLRSRIQTPIPEPDAYLEKPPEPDRLQAAVDRILCNRENDGA